ncbi:PQQ-binding-like beta-propeller repeat protein [Streptomyces sp. MS06]|uniref:outer membrane protein assembly factor BamB family protein n=1 Tax=Streptomyces sp. MS06 TaxID=3385974 RepID=UPI0039A20E5C
MTEERPTGQDFAEQEPGWAFRPRTPVGARSDGPPRPERPHRSRLGDALDRGRAPEPSTGATGAGGAAPAEPARPDRQTAPFVPRPSTVGGRPALGRAVPGRRSASPSEPPGPVTDPVTRPADAAPPEDVHVVPPEDVHAVPPEDVHAVPPEDVHAVPPEDAHAAPPEDAHLRGPDDAGDTRTGRGSRRRAARAVLALAVLAAAGGTAVALRHSEEVPVASDRAALVWKVAAPAAGDELIGSWNTGTLLVRASTRGGVSAYRLSDGKQVWRTTPETASAVPCAMSPRPAAGGVGTVAFGSDGHSCTTLAGVDSTTGKILWSVPLVDATHPTATAAETFVQGSVATIVSENFLGGLDVRTGHRVWGYRARGSYCNVRDWGAEGVVLVSDYCADQRSGYTLTAYDGETGKTLWTRTRPSSTVVKSILSGAPLVAALHTPVEDSVRVLTAAGAGRKLAVGNTAVRPGNETAADRSARLVGDVLVVPAEDATGDGIDAYDVTTGAKLWSRPQAALAASADGQGAVYAVTTSGAPQLLRLDPHTGDATPVTLLPRGGFTAGTVYVTPDGGVLELDAQGTSDAVRYYR